MKMGKACENCLYGKEIQRCQDPVYLARVKEIIAGCTEEETSIDMVYHFDNLYEEMFGIRETHEDQKKPYNDLLLSMEDQIRQQIEEQEDPLKYAVFLSRVGNYIDFGTLMNVSDSMFMEMFSKVEISEEDERVYGRFIKDCEKAKTFMLLADNCGEIVLDKLLIEQIKKRFPQLRASVMVRGADTLNDVTVEDAKYVGIDKVADIVSNGLPFCGVSYRLLPEEAKEAFDNTDVILSKGQANFESAGERGRHIYFLFLLKCDYFLEYFQKPQFTGMFIEDCPPQE